MKSNRCYYSLGVLTLGLSIIVCLISRTSYTSFISSAVAQSQTLSVNDPRPVAAALEILEAKYGVVITYEDVPYMHEEEIMDQTSSEYRQSHPGGPRALIPRGGSLEITDQILGRYANANETRFLIQKLLDTHAKKNNPGRFRLQQEEGIFHVIPTQVRDRSGKLVSIESILDTSISFPEQQRSVGATVELITDAISRTRGIKFVTGTTPLNPFSRTLSRQGAVNQKARDVLISTLKAINGKLSWQIFYGPGSKRYVLNVHGVR